MAPDPEKGLCELVFRDSIDPIVIADVWTHKIIQSNMAAAKVIGLPDIIGLDMFSLVSPAMKDELIASLISHISVGGVRELRIDVKTASGEIVPTIATTYFINYEGKKYFVGIFHTIKELKK
ncbi:MAG: PAS domain S-box protein, partial [Candidatus Micrarchaeia archaeon]